MNRLTQASIVIVSTTVDSQEKAERLATAIVDSRLAACVQQLPIRSLYRWKGAIESAPEILLVAKTRSRLAPRLVAFIRARHTYEVPEILVTPVSAGWGPYLAWIREETAVRGKEGKPGA